MIDEAIKELKKELDKPLKNKKDNFFLQIYKIFFIIFTLPGVLWISIIFILIYIPYGIIKVFLKGKI